MPGVRLVPPDSDLIFQKADRPFSNFQFVDTNYRTQSLGERSIVHSSPSIRRVFSQARSLGYKSLVIENIPPVGFVKEENEDIAKRYPDYVAGELKRLSFWETNITKKEDISADKQNYFLGYAILKQDKVASKNIDAWHVFESVLHVPNDEKTCITTAQTYKVRCGEEIFRVHGVLYCQQNMINKACAQVALRTLCSTVLPKQDLSYRYIHNKASSVTGDFDPQKGLTSDQVRAVLDSLKIQYRDVDYTVGGDDTKRDKFPYTKVLYAGVESGWVSLLGFKFKDIHDQDCWHIIPCLGHTFNKNTWVSNANLFYFKIGKDTKYVPSESWLGNFIFHDDNFGSNLCIPRQYIKKENVEYILSILPPKVNFDALQAEAAGAHFLYEVIPNIPKTKGYWLEQLIFHANLQQIVLRAIHISLDDYIEHLNEISGWEGEKENKEISEALKGILPTNLWVIEISLPELFPVNCRKLGEVVLNATKKPNESFQLIRLPEWYFFGTESDNLLPSVIQSHTQLAKSFL